MNKDESAAASATSIIPLHVPTSSLSNIRSPSTSLHTTPKRTRSSNSAQVKENNGGAMQRLSFTSSSSSASPSTHRNQAMQQ